MILTRLGIYAGTGAIRAVSSGLLTALLILFAGAAELRGQSYFWRKNDRNTFIRNIQFNFNTPSARAVGLGGAFVAIADDATAGMANPAGLNILTKPEISVHYKLSRFTREENVGTEADHNLTSEFHDVVGSQSYLSLVFPHGKYAFSLYRQELINFESSFQAPGFGSLAEFPWLDPADFQPGNQTMSDIQVNNWGAAFAVRPLHNLSLGISNIVSTLEFRFSEQLFQRSPQHNRPTRIFGVNSNSNDTRYSVNLGLKYLPFEQLSLGAVYRSGPRFKIINTVEDVDETTGRPILSQANQRLVFKVPDVYSFGAAWQMLDNLVLSADLVRVEYSDLISGLERNLKEDDVAVYIDEFPFVRFEDGDGVQDLMLDDGTEFHLGIEYTLFLRHMQIPLRAGFFTDPAHVVYTTIDDEALKRLFPRGRDDFHWTFGLGTVLGNKIQVDAAVNFSRNITEALISAVFRF